MSLDAERLRKIAALLDSPVDGEALAALRRASHILKGIGTTLPEAILRGALESAASIAEGPVGDDPMPERAMVCRFSVISREDLPGGAVLLRVRPSVTEAGGARAYRACLATGRAAAIIEARLFQDPAAEFLAKFSVPFRTHKEEPKVASVQAIA